MAKARPDYPHYRVSERAKSISSHKGAEGTKLPPPSENGGQRLAACRRCCAMYCDCCHLVIHNIVWRKVKKSFSYLQIKVKKNPDEPVTLDYGITDYIFLMSTPYPHRYEVLVAFF